MQTLTLLSGNEQFGQNYVLIRWTITYVDFARGTVSNIDLCIVTSNLISNSSMTTGPSIGSDHMPIEAILNIQPAISEVKVRPKWRLVV